jgi:membrane protease YdiL (CAAX protease family)
LDTEAVAAIQPNQLHTAVLPSSRIGKVIQFPLMRVLIAVVFITPAAMLHNVLVDYVFSGIEEPLFSYLLDVEGIINFALFLLSYRLYTRWIERRPAVEISGRGSVGETSFGFAIGGGLIAVITLMLILLGYYHLQGSGSPTILIHAIRLFGIGAFIQELVFRVIMFKNFEEWLGSWPAMVLIALIFGALHFGNPNATLFSSLMLAIQDILLTAAFMLTRRLWLVWGLHFGWNFLQDGIFGMANSGQTALPSWLTSSVSGPKWLTGGAFGVEASYVSTILCVIVALFILRAVVRQGKVLPAIWKR